MKYMLIGDTVLKSVDLNEGETLAVPPNVSAISAEDWQIMIAEAGSEAALIQALGVEDGR
jgi:hypothetical protein